MAVVAIGELVVDWLSYARGETIYTATEFYRALGGNATNVAIGLRRLRTPVRLVAKVGADLHADYLKQALAEEQVDCPFIFADPHHPTAQCYMTTTPSGDFEYRNWPRPNASDMLCAQDIDRSVFADAVFLHATGISLMIDPRRSAIRHAVNVAKELGVAFSFDGGFPTGADSDARKHAESFLHDADLLKLNEFELNFWAGSTLQRSTVEDTALAVFNHYQPLALFVTLAAQGSLVITAHGALHCPPYPVEPVSEVGAGDAFVAGSLHELMHTVNLSAPLSSLRQLTASDWRRVGRAGNIAGALACRQLSAYGGMPTADEFSAAVGKLPI